MSETLEHITDLLRANEEIEILRARLAEAVMVLEIAEEALDNYSDVVDGYDGKPRANRAMRALVEVEAMIKDIKAALPPPPAQEGE